MKKLFSLLLAMSLLSGCVKKDTTDAKAATYESYYETIVDATSFTEASDYYTLSGEMTQMDDGTYRYYLVIDDVQIAMYDIVFMAVEDDLPFAQARKMMPSIGIYDDTEYAMIPYQARQDAGYVKGLVISGNYDTSSVPLRVLVEWQGRNGETTYREFWKLTLTEDGFDSKAEAPAEEETEGEEGTESNS